MSRSSRSIHPLLQQNDEYETHMLAAAKLKAPAANAKKPVSILKANSKEAETNQARKSIRFASQTRPQDNGPIFQSSLSKYEVHDYRNRAKPGELDRCLL